LQGFAKKEIMNQEIDELGSESDLSQRIHRKGTKIMFYVGGKRTAKFIFWRDK